MPRWYYDPTSPETIFGSFVELDRMGMPGWDEAEQNIFNMAWEKATNDGRGKS